MKLSREEAIKFLSKYVGNKYYTPQCQEAHRMAVEALREQEERRWIPVTEGMPEEHDSMFAKFYGTERWMPGMFRTVSEDVIVCIEYEGGARQVKTARTQSGEWSISSIWQAKVTHWMPLPEPPKEDI